MANHLTPEEAAQEFGMETPDLVAFCVEHGVPIYQGKICKGLLGNVMEATERSLANAELAVAAT